MRTGSRGRTTSKCGASNSERWLYRSATNPLLLVRRRRRTRRRVRLPIDHFRLISRRGPSRWRIARVGITALSRVSTTSRVLVVVRRVAIPGLGHVGLLLIGRLLRRVIDWARGAHCCHAALAGGKTEAQDQEEDGYGDTDSLEEGEGEGVDAEMSELGITTGWSLLMRLYSQCRRDLRMRVHHHRYSSCCSIHTRRGASRGEKWMGARASWRWMQKRCGEER